ncbi:MAG: hypothetical protein DWQ04_31520 [Chloroflexi bacterium]|nr:MAG: hypothetical protein DWQ04_31520 [Chloroflexota bacterium]
MSEDVMVANRSNLLNLPKLWYTFTNLFTTGRLLALMMGLQTIWLAAIWVSGAAGNAHKLPRLILFTIITGTTVAWLPDL